MIINLPGIKRTEPVTVFSWPHTSGRRIIQILIMSGSFNKLLVHFFIANCICKESYTVIIISIFQGLAYTFVFIVRQHHSIGFIRLESKTICICTGQHSFQCKIFIKITNPFQISIYNYRNTVIANHTISFTR